MTGRVERALLRRWALSLLGAVFMVIWLCASHRAGAEEAPLGVETRLARADHEAPPLPPPQLLSVERVPDAAADTVETPPERVDIRGPREGREARAREAPGSHGE